MSYANALDIKLLNVSTSKERNSITNHNNNGINKQKSTPCILSHVHAHPKKQELYSMARTTNIFISQKQLNGHLRKELYICIIISSTMGIKRCK